MPELEQLRSDLEKLQETIRELSSELETVGIVLKGSKALDITGVFERLKESERFAKECDERNSKQFEDIKKEVSTRIEMLDKDMEAQMNILLEKLNANNTAITAQLMQLNSFRTTILSILNIFKSKNFWKVIIAAMGLISFGKSYNNILHAIGEVLNGIGK